MYSRKGSLNISVEAIVILILAVTMLGLGLTFMKGTFTRATGQLEEVGGQVKEQIRKDIESSGDKLVLLQTDITVKKGESKELYYGIRNDQEDEYTFLVKGSGSFDTDGSFNGDAGISCFSAIDEGPNGAYIPQDIEKYISFSVDTSRKIKQDEIFVGKMKVKISSDAPKTSYSCGMVVAIKERNEEHARKDFYITVE